MNDRLLREFTVEPHGIDQKMVCVHWQQPHCVQHGQTRRLVNIDLIDSPGIDGGNSPRDAMRTNADRESFATLGREQFRIPQAANAVGGVKNHSGGHYGTEERPAAHFIDSGNMLRS